MTRIAFSLLTGKEQGTFSFFERVGSWLNRDYAVESIAWRALCWFVLFLSREVTGKRTGKAGFLDLAKPVFLLEPVERYV